MPVFDFHTHIALSDDECDLFEVPPDDGLGGPIEQLAFTPDGKSVFAASWNLRSARWDVATRKRTALTSGRFGHQLVTTATGLRSVSNNYQPRLHEITVFDPVAGLALQTIAWADPKEVGNNGLRAYALTADGSTLLVASAAGGAAAPDQRSPRPRASGRPSGSPASPRPLRRRGRTAARPRARRRRARRASRPARRTSPGRAARARG